MFALDGIDYQLVLLTGWWRSVGGYACLRVQIIWVIVVGLAGDVRVCDFYFTAVMFRFAGVLWFDFDL